jgi:hypothetical protein
MANNFPNLRPTLNLDMVNGIYVDPRVTFTRAGGRTFFGREMVKAEENLFLRSQEVQSWGFRDGATVTSNNVTAPDGTATADTVLFTDTATARAYSVFTGNGSTFTFSVFAKYVDKQWIAVRLTDGTSATRFAWFDIQNGIVGTVQTNLTATIVASAEGFYRCIVTVSSTASSNAAMVYGVSADNVSTNTGAAGSVAIWGAQLEQRSSATAYTATTTQPITRYQRLLRTAAANEWPREFDPVTGECLGRSVWESRTNLLTYSEDFTNAAWVKDGATVTANQIIAPDGTLTADRMIASATTAVHEMVQTYSASAGTFTTSYIVKASGYSFIQITSSQSATDFINFDLTAGTVGSLLGYTGRISSLGNGWFRCTATVAVTTPSFNQRVSIVASSSAARRESFAGDGTSGIYIWGAQLEAGAFATPYIPTVASQITRLADSAVMTGVNFSSWYRQDEGAFFVDFTRPFTITSSASNGAMLQVDDGTLNNRIMMVQEFAGGASKIGTFVGVGGATQENSYPLASGVVGNTPYKQSFSYKTNDFIGCVNGGTVTTDTVGILPVVTQMNIGRRVSDTYLNGYIKRLTYYPQAFTAANHQAITR